MKPTVPIPESHIDLLQPPVGAVLATMGPDGFPRARPARCELDGDHVAVSAARESAPAGDVAVRPVATVLVVDPGDGSRWIEVRGDVEPAGADNGRPPGGQARLVLRIRPTRVNLDAIHR